MKTKLALVSLSCTSRYFRTANI